MRQFRWWALRHEWRRILLVNHVLIGNIGTHELIRWLLFWTFISEGSLLIVYLPCLADQPSKLSADILGKDLVQSKSDIRCIGLVRSWLCSTRHCTLPKQPPFRVRVSRGTAELAGDGMKHAPVVKDDQVAFLPSMAVDVPRGVQFVRQLVAYAPDLVKVIYDGNFARGRIGGVEGVHTAPKNLQVRLPVAMIAPNHLDEWKSSAYFSRFGKSLEGVKTENGNSYNMADLTGKAWTFIPAPYE